MLFDSLASDITTCALGIFLLLAYWILRIIVKKKPIQELKGQNNRGRILSDVFFCLAPAFMAGSGAGAIVEYFTSWKKLTCNMIFGLGLFTMGALGLVIYLVDRKLLDEFDDKRFYDVLAFAILGGLAVTGVVLTVLYFIR